MEIIDYLVRLWRLKSFLCPSQIVGYCRWLGTALTMSHWFDPRMIWKVMEQWQKIQYIFLLYHGVVSTECIASWQSDFEILQVLRGYRWALRCRILVTRCVPDVKKEWQRRNLEWQADNWRRNGGGEIWSEEPTIACGLCIEWSGRNPTKSACSVARINKQRWCFRPPTVIQTIDDSAQS